MLTIQQPAPAFSLLDDTNTTRTLEDQKGKWTLIYFYPKDDTPGCTTEACTIRDVYHEFERMNVDVIGVSKDSPESHREFKAKYELPFTLLSDEAGDMIRAYGAWNDEREMANRISYLISPDLTIQKAYPNVDPATHAADLLKDLEELVGE